MMLSGKEGSFHRAFAAHRITSSETDYSQDEENDSSTNDSFHEFPVVEKLYGREEELDKLLAAYQRLSMQEVAEAPLSLHQGSIRSSISVMDKEFNQTEPEKANHRGSSSLFSPQPHRKELVLISGDAGVGKSRLVRQFQREISQDSRTGPFFAMGKAEAPLDLLTSSQQEQTSVSASNEDDSSCVDSYALLQQEGSSSSVCHKTTTPFQSLADACTELCLQVFTKLSGEERLKLIQGLFGSLGGMSNVKTLTSLVTNLEDLMLLLPEEEQPTSPSWAQQEPRHQLDHQQYETLPYEPTCELYASSQELHLERLFRHFLKAVASTSRPLVLVLDDLQWTDTATMHLISSALVDHELQNVMIIGTYRTSSRYASVPEQVFQAWTKPYWQSFDKRTQHEEMWLQRRAAEVQIRLENLNPAVVKQMVVEALGERLKGGAEDQNNRGDNPRISRVAQLVFQQTKGNAFYLQQTIKSLGDVWENMQDEPSGSCGHSGEDDESINYLQHFLLQLHKSNIDSDATSVGLTETEDNDLAAHELSHNIQSMMLMKMRALSEGLQRSLSLASQLKTSFELHDLFALMTFLEDDNCNEKLPNDDRKQEKLRNFVQELDEAVVQGLLENTIGTTIYNFAHDSIKEAAHSLLLLRLPDHLGDKAEYRRLCWKVGIYFLKSYRGVDRMSHPQTEVAGGSKRRYYMAVNKLNAVPLSIASDMASKGFVEHASSRTSNIRWILVDYNIQAGEMAKEQSAFRPALSFFNTAIRLVEQENDETAWSEKYNELSHLYQQAAEVLFYFGENEKGNRCIRKVLMHAQALHERLDAYLILVNGYGISHRHFEAYLIGRKALRERKEFPRFINTVNMLMQYSAIKKAFQKIPDIDILSFPPMKDKVVVKTLELLLRTASRAFQSNEPLTCLMCLWKVLHIFLSRRELCPAAAEAVMDLGFLSQGFFNEYDFGMRMANLAMELIEIVDAGWRRTRVIFVYINYLRSWDLPLPKTLEIAQSGYKCGMELGDMEYGFLNMTLCCLFRFTAGDYLRDLIPEMEQLFNQATQYKSGVTLAFHVPILSMVKALAGETHNDPLAWATEGHRQLTKEEQKSQTFSRIWFYMSRAIAAYILGEIELAETARSNISSIKADPSYPTMSNHTFFECLIAAAVFRRTGRRKYRIKAKKKLDLMKTFLDDRGMKLVHRYHIMKADYISSTKKGKTAMSATKLLFDKAISASARAGFCNDAALANELAGEYFLRRYYDCAARTYSKPSRTDSSTSDDVDHAAHWSRYYLSKAYSLYYVWGAREKMVRMEKSRSEFMDVSLSEAYAGSRYQRASRARSLLSHCSSIHLECDTACDNSSNFNIRSSSHSFSNHKSHNGSTDLDFSSKMFVDIPESAATMFINKTNGASNASANSTGGGGGNHQKKGEERVGMSITNVKVTGSGLSTSGIISELSSGGLVGGDFGED